MWIWIRNTAFFLANLQICDLQTGAARKFADYSLQICDLQTGSPQKFANVRLRNEPKTLPICDFRTKKKFVFPPLLLTGKIELMTAFFRFSLSTPMA